MCSANPLGTLFVILNIFLLEVVLSIDNAAVLATLVKDLPENKRNKALHWGIIGAYVFRGLALLFVTFLVNIWWIKPLGGLYLCWMTYGYFKGKSTPQTDDDVMDKENNWLYRNTVGLIGQFWATVALVELMDMVFSIDNIFAVVAFTKNYVVIILGVFVGIIAMRFVAQQFVKLMEKYDFLEDCAFVVIGILGVKLFLSILVHFVPSTSWIESESVDLVMSAVTMLVFIVPILWHKFAKPTTA